ncbi:MAG: type II CAAX prenyl endopeptidase Rce1 family protein, partial [Acidobacteriota bacterium]
LLWERRGPQRAAERQNRAGDRALSAPPPPVPRGEPLAGLLAGLGSGAFMAAGLAGLYLLALRGGPLLADAAPRVADRVTAIGAGTPVRFLLLTLFLSGLHSLLEEYYWRWFVFGRLQRRLGRVSSVALSSLAFTAHHVIVLHAFAGPDHVTATACLSAAVAAAGALWALLYVRYATLAPSWLSHLLVDVAIMAIGYDLVFGG